MFATYACVFLVCVFVLRVKCTQRLIVVVVVVVVVAGAKKGEVNCCGYRCEEFSKEDIEEHGTAGVKLVPHNDERRVWMFKCEDEKER